MLSCGPFVLRCSCTRNHLLLSRAVSLLNPESGSFFVPSCAERFFCATTERTRRSVFSIYLRQEPCSGDCTALFLRPPLFNACSPSVASRRGGILPLHRPPVSHSAPFCPFSSASYTVRGITHILYSGQKVLRWGELVGFISPNSMRAAHHPPEAALFLVCSDSSILPPHLRPSKVESFQFLL